MRKVLNESQQNVLGTELLSCSTAPITGFYRDGCCKTGDNDYGTHTVCAQITDEFLAFTRSRGNDLSTPNPLYNFPGLKEGDFWCLCVSRWLEALKVGKAPKIRLASTHIKTLNYVSIETLKAYEL